MSHFMERNFLRQRKYFAAETIKRNSRFQIPDDIQLDADIPYLEDKNPAHQMDIYRPTRLVPSRPVIINVHGGGLIAGSKEFNRRFCVQLCKHNFLVFSIEHQLVPEVSVHQLFEDVSRAMDAVKAYIPQYHGNPQQVYMVGDSAGAYLIAYTIAMQRSPELAGAAHVQPSSLSIQAAGLLSGMFYTRKHDLIGLFLPKYLYGANYQKSPFAPYTNPEHPAILSNLPPCFLSTSSGDFLRRYTLSFANALEKQKSPHMLYHPAASRKLLHAFSVFDPERPESQEAIHTMVKYLLQFRGNDYCPEVRVPDEWDTCS